MTSSMRFATAFLLGAVACSAFAADPPAASAEVVAEPIKPAEPTPTPAPTSKPAKGKKNAADRLELDTTVVTGNRELPKVLYIVPWKKSDIGELPGQPFNTLLDEALVPVDRDVFRREVKYYGAVTTKQPAGDTTPPAPSSTGKGPTSKAQ